VPGLSASPRNPFDIVQSADGDREYIVKTLAAVDEALRKLGLKIAAAAKTPDKQAALREDRDLLLDRRNFLELLEPTADMGVDA
jgi:hypothetical protein